jgi:hypothetical protein
MSRPKLILSVLFVRGTGKDATVGRRKRKMGSSSAQIKDKVMRKLLSLWPEWTKMTESGLLKGPSISQRIERLVDLKLRIETISENYANQVPVSMIKEALEKR